MMPPLSPAYAYSEATLVEQRAIALFTSRE